MVTTKIKNARSIANGNYEMRILNAIENPNGKTILKKDVFPVSIIWDSKKEKWEIIYTSFLKELGDSAKEYYSSKQLNQWMKYHRIEAPHLENVNSVLYKMELYKIENINIK